MALTLFCVVLVSTAICTKQTVATAEYGVHPILALFMFWFSMAWLAILEGGLTSMVGLQPIPKDLYKDTHPKAYMCTVVSHREETMERFIVGRQYLDTSIVFITSFMVSSVDGAHVLGLPEMVNKIFLGANMGVIICTIVFGQLISVVNCSHNMLDFINNWCMVLSTRLALFVEMTGILHAVYFLQIVFAKVANRHKAAKGAGPNNKTDDKSSKTLDTKRTTSNVSDPEQDTNSSDSGSTTPEPNPNNSTDNNNTSSNNNNKNKPLWRRISFWVRVVLSLGMSVYTVVIFCVALVGGNTKAPSGTPLYVSFPLLVTLLLLAGIMDAIQVALFAVKHVPADLIEANDHARRNCEYMFKTERDGGWGTESGKLRAFLMGRQFAHTIILFMIARIISVDMKVPGETLFGVNPLVQRIFFNSGILNALVCAIFASLAWRVTANYFPLAYLGSPITIWIIRFCVLVEATGVTDSAWILAKIPDAVVRYRTDDHYIARARASAGPPTSTSLLSLEASWEAGSEGEEGRQHQDLEAGEGRTRNDN
jgi:hypothetical protein